MTIVQPIQSNLLKAPDHSKLHRVLGIDNSAADQSVVIDSNGNLIGHNDFVLDTGNFKLNSGYISNDGTDNGLSFDSSNNAILSNNLDVGGELTVGDATNNLSVASDGTITLNGTARVYDGIEVQATDFKQPASGAATLTNRGMGVAYAFSDGSEESIRAELRIPAKWVNTEDITLVGIWSTPATSADCDWEIDYLFRAEDEDMTETTPDGTLQGYQTSSATANGLVHSTMTIPAADFDSGDKKLIFQVRRDGDDASDTLNDTAYVHAIMVKGVLDKLGGSL